MEFADADLLDWDAPTRTLTWEVNRLAISTGREMKLYMVVGIHFLPKDQPENSFQPFPRTQLWEPLEPFFLWKLLRKDRRSESGSEFTIGWYLDIGPNKMA